MTKQELNRDIKRLWRKFESRPIDGKVFEYKTMEAVEDEIKREWTRLWKADDSAEYMNKEQLKAMLRINGCLRINKLHTIHLFFKVNL